MKELQERIKKDGIAVNEDILKVDSFINHQVDPVLMQHIGEAFAEHFKDQGITKVATIESSGIAPALMTAMCMGLPMIILKKQPSKILNDNLFQTEVTSFTKGTSYELTLSSKFVSEKDHVLIIDDFLANGSKKHFSRDMKNWFLRDLMCIPLQESAIWQKMRLNFWKIKPPLPQQGVLICPCSYKASAITLPV